MRENLSQHLAVVHLHESYFYDPVLTIKLFCHEAAHYLSNRHRKERALYIFRVVSFLLLANTPLGDGMKEAKNNSVLAVMADALADFLLEKFEEQTPHLPAIFHITLRMLVNSSASMPTVLISSGTALRLSVSATDGRKPCSKRKIVILKNLTVLCVPAWSTFRRRFNPIIW